jgi:hypothetical protein
MREIKRDVQYILGIMSTINWSHNHQAGILKGIENIKPLLALFLFHMFGYYQEDDRTLKLV